MGNFIWLRIGRTVPRLSGFPSRLALVTGFLLLSALLFILPFSGATSAPLFQFFTPSPSPPPPTGAIQGTKFDDLNGNGLIDFGEAGVAGVTICITPLFSCITTNGNSFGNYSFANLPPGSYTVNEILPPGRINTTPLSQTVAVFSGQTIVGVNFGNRVPPPPVPPGALQGTKFDDLNGNGFKDGGEPGVAGVFICLQGFSCILTDPNGNYSFVNLPPGTYTVFESVPFGRVNTTPIFQTPTVASGLTTVDVNFGNRVITPPPPDVQIVSQAGTTTNDTPTQSRFTNLVIRKTISICSPVNPPKVTLTWPFAPPIIGSMANIGGILWEVVFSPPFPGGTSTMRIDIDCPPGTPGYPEDPTKIGFEDAVQIGNIVFLDPSGTIKDACTGGALVGATVTLLKESPPPIGNFVVPNPADHIPATNPQTTGADGKYAWVVVPGTYKVKAAKSGFVPGESPPVVIPPPVTGLDITLARVVACPPPNQPPNVSNAVASQPILWPPNNKFVPITVLGVTDPDGDTVTIVITSIVQDEPVEAVGDGRFTPDGQGVGASTAQVRAERIGTPKVPGNGRVYHIRFTASDGKGGSANGEVLVKVPHDQDKGTVVVDGGALYDSTTP